MATDHTADEGTSRDERGTPSGADPGEPVPLEPADPALRGPRRPAASLLTFGTVALVLVIVVVLVVIKVTGNSTVSTITKPVTPTPAAPAVVQAVSRIPASVYDSVGIDSPVATVTPPVLLHAQPPLTDGHKAQVVFVGNEFCPYCAAERWALVAALSRFGTFTRLNAAQSSGAEAFSNTPTFTFFDSRYKSPFLHASLVEHYGDQKNHKGTAFSILERIPHADKVLMKRYDRSSSSGSDPILPFVDLAGRAVVTGGSFSPSILQQLSATQIAAGLKDPSDPATRAIVATANYFSAVLCTADHDRPLRVCAGAGVGAALSALGLGP